MRLVVWFAVIAICGYPFVARADAAAGALPKYGPPSQEVVYAYRNFLLAHPGATIQTAPAPGGMVIIRFSGPGACKGDACATTILAPNDLKGFSQVFSQVVQDLRLLPPKEGPYAWLSTDDGGIWKLGRGVYVEDLSSLATVTVPSHYLTGQTKAAVDKALIDFRWPQNAPYVASLIAASGQAPETLVITPDLRSSIGLNLCSSDGCPIWFLIPGPGGSWTVSVKSIGTGAYGVLFAANAAGGHDFGVADEYGWNQYSWRSDKGQWLLSREVANLPGAPQL